MQPVMRRRRRAWLMARQDQGQGYDPGRHWTCATGGSNAQDPLCPPAVPDLGAPEIQHCGYQNAPTRQNTWIAILAGYGVAAPGVARTASPVGHYERRQTMPAGFSTGYAHDGGGGSPYGYPETYEAFGVFSPLRRNRAREMRAAATHRTISPTDRSAARRLHRWADPATRIRVTPRDDDPAAWLPSLSPASLCHSWAGAAASRPRLVRKTARSLRLCCPMAPRA